MFQEAGSGLFLWETFVTEKAKGQSDLEDAAVGVHAFLACLPDLLANNAIGATEVHSLIEATLLRTGWSKDLALLKTACVVVKPGNFSKS
jgi:hypothetical protein